MTNLTIKQKEALDMINQYVSELNKSGRRDEAFSFTLDVAIIPREQLTSIAVLSVMERYNQGLAL